MSSWQVVRAFAGIVILFSLVMGLTVSPWWFALTAFVGANLLQSSFTRWCPLEIVLRRFGVRSGC